MSNNQESVKKAPKKAALGRGLGSLLGAPSVEDAPKASPAMDKVSFSEAREPALRQGILEKPVSPGPNVPDHLRIWHVPIENICGNKDQPRKQFVEEHLDELVASIKEKGILQPIVARKIENGMFEIIAGERRWRAAQRSGLKEVPVIIKDSGNQEALELALIENIQRQDLNPIEEAEAYSMLMTEYDLTQQQVADKVGKDRATVANLLRLLNLTPEVRDYISEGRLSLGLGKVLLALTDPKKQKKVAKKVIKSQLSVRATEKLIQRLRQQTDFESALSTQPPAHEKLVENLKAELQKIMGTKVTIDYNAGKGKVGVYFYSDDELNNIIDKIRDAWKH